MSVWNLEEIEGYERLSKDFCNYPVHVTSGLIDRDFDKPYAAIMLCGRLVNHFGPCDAIPPVKDVT